MRPAAVLAGMEMQSQAEVSAVPNIFYPGGDEAQLHGFITTLAASGFPLQATLKADEGDFMWNPLNLLPSGGWQPAIFLVSPVAGGINGGGRINSLVARIMNKSDEEWHGRLPNEPITPLELCVSHQEAIASEILDDLLKLGAKPTELAITIDMGNSPRGVGA